MCCVSREGGDRGVGEREIHKITQSRAISWSWHKSEYEALMKWTTPTRNTKPWERSDTGGGREASWWNAAIHQSFIRDNQTLSLTLSLSVLVWSPTQRHTRSQAFACRYSIGWLNDSTISPQIHRNNVGEMREKEVQTERCEECHLLTALYIVSDGFCRSFNVSNTF